MSRAADHDRELALVAEKARATGTLDDAAVAVQGARRLEEVRRLGLSSTRPRGPWLRSAHATATGSRARLCAPRDKCRIDLRQLRSFIAVAEELHFSRAAARLHLAQSALSAQIRQLETELGGPLLVRNTRRVTLTPAGESLLADGRAILAALDRAVGRARALARGEEGSLVVGSLSLAPGSVLAPLLTQFGARHPDVRVEVRALDFNDTVRGLREGRADLGFTYAPLGEPDLVVTPLLTEPRVVVLPRTHPLAAASEPRPADLADEVFVMQPDSTPREWRDFWLLVDELGHRPPTSPYIGENIEEWLHLISRGEGIDTCPAAVSRYFAWPEVVYVTLRDAPPATLVLAHHVDAQSPLIEEFARLAVEVAEAAAGQAETPYGPAIA